MLKYQIAFEISIVNVDVLCVYIKLIIFTISLYLSFCWSIAMGSSYCVYTLLLAFCLVRIIIRQVTTIINDILTQSNNDCSVAFCGSKVIAIVVTYDFNLDFIITLSELKNHIYRKHVFDLASVDLALFDLVSFDLALSTVAHAFTTNQRINRFLYIYIMYTYVRCVAIHVHICL